VTGFRGVQPAYRVKINGDYNPETGRVDAYLDTQNLIPTSVRVKTTLTINQVTSDPGTFTTKKPRKRWEKDVCKKTWDSNSMTNWEMKGQRKNNEHLTAKINPASLVRIRVDTLVDPDPLIGGNPFSFGGQSVLYFTQGSNTFESNGFHMGEQIMNLDDL
jgi:hypothetical protein